METKDIAFAAAPFSSKIRTERSPLFEGLFQATHHAFSAGNAASCKIDVPRNKKQLPGSGTITRIIFRGMNWIHAQRTNRRRAPRGVVLFWGTADFRKQHCIVFYMSSNDSQTQR